MAPDIQSAQALRSVVVSAMSATAMRAAILAHQGGWDEVLLVAGPILLIAGLLVLAKRRVERNAADAPTTAGPPADTTTAGPPADTHDR